MSLLAVVALNGVRLCFCLRVLIKIKQGTIGIKVVCIITTNAVSLQVFKQQIQGFLRAITTTPGQESFGMTAKDFPYPELLFF